MLSHKRHTDVSINKHIPSSECSSVWAISHLPLTEKQCTCAEIHKPVSLRHEKTRTCGCLKRKKQKTVSENGNLMCDLALLTEGFGVFWTWPELNWELMMKICGVTIVWELSLALFLGFDHLHNPYLKVVKAHQVMWCEGGRRQHMCVCVARQSTQCV